MHVQSKQLSLLLTRLEFTDIILIFKQNHHLQSNDKLLAHRHLGFYLT